MLNLMEFKWIMLLHFNNRFELVDYLRHQTKKPQTTLHPYYVYMLCEDGVPFYVGISKSIKRVHSHETDLYHTRATNTRRNFLKEAKIRKIHASGKVISYTFIGWFRNQLEVYHAERSLILHYGQIINRTGVLTNLADGGAGRAGLGTSEKQKQAARIANSGPKSEEVKKKLSESLTKTFQTRGGTFKGRTHSPETKVKMSAAQLKDSVYQNRLRGERHYNHGKTRSEQTRLKIKAALAAKDLTCTEGRKEQLRQFWANAPILTCPHCGKSMRAKAPFVKFHGDRCKEKQETEPAQISDILQNVSTHS